MTSEGLGEDEFTGSVPAFQGIVGWGRKEGHGGDLEHGGHQAGRTVPGLGLDQEAVLDGAGRGRDSGQEFEDLPPGVVAGPAGRLVAQEVENRLRGQEGPGVEVQAVGPDGAFRIGVGAVQ